MAGPSYSLAGLGASYSTPVGIEEQSKEASIPSGESVSNHIDKPTTNELDTEKRVFAEIPPSSAGQVAAAAAPVFRSVIKRFNDAMYKLALVRDSLRTPESDFAKAISNLVKLCKEKGASLEILTEITHPKPLPDAPPPKIIMPVPTVLSILLSALDYENLSAEDTRLFLENLSPDYQLRFCEDEGFLPLAKKFIEHTKDKMSPDAIDKSIAEKLEQACALREKDIARNLTPEEREILKNIKERATS